jgi:hypothetical protein
LLLLHALHCFLSDACLSDFNVEPSEAIERLERFKQSFGYSTLSMLPMMGERWAISHRRRVLSQSGRGRIQMHFDHEKTGPCFLIGDVFLVCRKE